MKLLFHSIRQKLFAAVLLTTLVALLVSLVAIVAYDLRLYHRNLILDMTTQSELLGHMTAPALAFDDQRLATQNLNLLRIRPEVHAAAIYTARGGLFATYAAPGEASPFPPLPGADVVTIEGRKLVLFKRIFNDGVMLGTVYLRADYALIGRILDYAGIAAVVTLCAMFIAFLVMARLERVVTRPLFAIAGIAREVVAQRNYSRRAEKMSDDEIGTLVDSFNDMLAEIERRTKELEASNREIVREAGQRNRAQQEVMRLNADLEARVHDRTAQLEAANDALIQAKAVAESANQAKSAFLSSMSHELRTPLNAILGFAQLLDSTTIPATPEQKKEFTAHILKAGRHLLTLINEVLDLAKVESGTMTLSLEPVSLADVMQETQAMIDPMGKQRGIRIVFPEQNALYVLADRTRLKQILLNLLSNAIKYNREMGAVILDCASFSDRVRISVQDTGAGLRPEQLNALFQPFNRLGQESGAEEGTGIGLVVTKRLVELMGGDIGVTSSVGVGSVFWIDLKSSMPLVSCVAPIGAGKEIVQAAAGRDQQSAHTLLYVEDNPANLKLVEEIVRFRTDLHLLSAPDGHLGIELARAHLPQVIVMDINLPGMSGNEAHKVLHSDPATAHIPIIALTANAMPRDVENGLAAGFFRYITKPLNIDEFIEAIDSALETAAHHEHQNK